MKQIHEAVQALESDIGFWRPSWILLKQVKNAKKKINRQIPQASMQIFGNNPSRGFQMRAETKCGGGRAQHKQ